VSTEEHLRQLYYDFAGSPGSNVPAPLLEMTERSHISTAATTYTRQRRGVGPSHRISEQQVVVSGTLPRNRSR
jgi:hypothetical protein